MDLVEQPSRNQEERTAALPATIDSNSQAVLLYYKYLDLGEHGRAAVSDWYRHHCLAEGLRGRCVLGVGVRVRGGVARVFCVASAFTAVGRLLCAHAFSGGRHTHGALRFV